MGKWRLALVEGNLSSVEEKPKKRPRSEIKKLKLVQLQKRKQRFGTIHRYRSSVSSFISTLWCVTVNPSVGFSRRT
ncbi:hypothetical protein L1887_19993 [Cichorium endivia]|nr:hypothetical protein L1887_19993 [Cichorium endivia]